MIYTSERKRCHFLAAEGAKSIMGESEVARLRQQLEMECIAMQQGLTGYAVTARHEIIQRRYKAVGHCQKQLEQLVGKEEAAFITAETYVKVIG